TLLFKEAPANVVAAAAFSPDGKLLATFLNEGHTVDFSQSLWGIQNNHPVARLDLAQDSAITGVTVAALNYSPNGQILALRAYGTLKGNTTVFVWLWDAKSYKPLLILPESDDALFEGSMAFSPDGKLLAVADTRIHLYAVTQ